MVFSSRRRYRHTAEPLMMIIITEMMRSLSEPTQTQSSGVCGCSEHNTLGAGLCVYSLFVSIRPWPLQALWIWIWAPNEHAVSMETCSLTALSGCEGEKRLRARASVFTDTRPGPRVAKQQSMRERADRSWSSDISDTGFIMQKHCKHQQTHQIFLWGKRSCVNTNICNIF